MKTVKFKNWVTIVVTVLLLNGCALIYLPALILAPLQPFIITAVRLAARYGPMLLLLAETDSNLPGNPKNPEMMIAMSPENPDTAKLASLETQLATEIANNKKLKYVTIVDVNSMTPEWLAEQIKIAHKKGCKLRAVFVDSRSFSKAQILSKNIVADLDNKKIGLFTKQSTFFVDCNRQKLSIEKEAFSQFAELK
jgi:hypothetical protein